MDALERSELAISRLLRNGVMLSGAVLAFGWTLKLIQILNSAQIGSPNPESVARSVSELIDGFQHGSSASWISLGVALLVSLPIVRVALTFYLFAKRKDALFMGLTFYVLALLAAGVILGKAL